MHSGRVREFFTSSKTAHRLHLVSIDPCRHEPDSIKKKISDSVNSGVDGFLLGGSTGVDRAMIETFTVLIRKALEDVDGSTPRPPLILFPSSAQTGIASMADAVLFLSLLNSTDVCFLVREQSLAAPHLRRAGLEAVGCGMIVVEPGGTAGKVGKAELLGRNDLTAAVGYAAAAEAFGFPLVYLNAGSGSDRPVPPEMIHAVSRSIGIPLIVGGGLTSPENAAAAVEAGADIVVTGTAIEDCGDLKTIVSALSAAIHSRPPSGRS